MHKLQGTSSLHRQSCNPFPRPVLLIALTEVYRLVTLFALNLHSIAVILCETFLQALRMCAMWPVRISLLTKLMAPSPHQITGQEHHRMGDLAPCWLQLPHTAMPFCVYFNRPAAVLMGNMQKLLPACISCDWNAGEQAGSVGWLWGTAHLLTCSIMKGWQTRSNLRSMTAGKAALTSSPANLPTCRLRAVPFCRVKQ